MFEMKGVKGNGGDSVFMGLIVADQPGEANPIGIPVGQLNLDYCFPSGRYLTRAFHATYPSMAES